MTNNNFAVALGAGFSNKLAKNILMNRLQSKYPHLSVAGLEQPFFENGKFIPSVEYAGKGDFLRFGIDKSHDVTYSKHPTIGQVFGATPTYDLVKDWELVNRKLEAFADSKQPKNKCEGCPKAGGTTSRFY